MPPMFSVVIATRNRPEYLSQALDSVLAQSHTDFEVLVVDDASDTPVHLPLDGRVELVRRSQRGGAAGARNEGVARANGEWVVFLDDDDAWLEPRLARLADAIAAHPTWSLVTTDADIQREGRSVGSWYNGREVPEHDQLAELLGRNYVYGSAAVRRSYLDQVGGFDESLTLREDYDLWLRLVEAGAVVGIVPEKLAVYRQGQGKAARDRVRSHEATMQILERALEWDLTASESAAAQDHLRRMSDRLKVQRAHVNDAATTERRAWWSVARARSLPLSTRVAAVASAIAGRRPPSPQPPRR
jgi:glycosyltransferase involved in cell wall biosynthesis